VDPVKQSNRRSKPQPRPTCYYCLGRPATRDLSARVDEWRVTRRVARPGFEYEFRTIRQPAPRPDEQSLPTCTQCRRFLRRNELIPIFSGGARVDVKATSLAADAHLEEGWRLYDSSLPPAPPDLYSYAGRGR
jgi:hypothetical protein